MQYAGPIEEALDFLEDERYDAVVLADVLEHLVDPAEVLRRLWHSLSPDGTISVCVCRRGIIATLTL